MKVFHGNWTTFLIALFLTLLGAILLFWVPLVILFSLGNLSVTNVSGIPDTLALAMSTALSIQSVYVPTSSTSTMILALESGIGRLILAGVTAILVVKASKVQNNIVVNDHALIHKRHGSWYISVRVGVMYGQRIFGCHAKLAVIGNIPGHDGPINIVNLKLHDNSGDGEFEINAIPRNVRHRIDETSPLFSIVDKLEQREDVSDVLDCIKFQFHGVDEVTGRGVGKSVKFLTLTINRNVQFKDVILSKGDVISSMKRGSLLGSRRERYNLKRSNSVINLFDRIPCAKYAVFWPNFWGIKSVVEEGSVELEMKQNEKDEEAKENPLDVEDKV